MHVASRLIACLTAALLAAMLFQTACSSCDKEGAPTEEGAAAEGAEEADGEPSKASPDTESAKAAKGEAPAAGDEENAEDPRAKAAAERARAAEGAGEASVDSLDPEEQRRIDRERRIAELKRRNEERRKELVARASATAG